MDNTKKNGRGSKPFKKKRFKKNKEAAEIQTEDSEVGSSTVWLHSLQLGQMKILETCQIEKTNLLLNMLGKLIFLL